MMLKPLSRSSFYASLVPRLSSLTFTCSQSTFSSSFSTLSSSHSLSNNSSDSSSTSTSPKIITGKPSAISGYNVMNVFDRNAKRLQRDRAARRADYSNYEYLRQSVAEHVADRLFDIAKRFPVLVDLGCGNGHLSKVVTKDNVDSLIQLEFSEVMANRAKYANVNSISPYSELGEAVSNNQPLPVDNFVEERNQLVQSNADPKIIQRKDPFLLSPVTIVADEEFLPLKPNSVDAVVSSLDLHWVNDLPGVLVQVQRSLKPDGVFIATMFGEDTLYELRCSLQLAEQERLGGFHPHISPFTDVRDAGNLLTRAGFVITTVDMEKITVNYPSMMELLLDLQGMAENNASWSRVPMLNRDALLAAAATYKHVYGNGEDESVPATFQILHMIGWKPGPNQSKAAKRGSATSSLKDLDQVTDTKV